MDIAYVFYAYLPCIIALYVITQHLLHKFLNFPPSPFPVIPIIGHLYLLKKPIQKTLSNLSNLYGPVFFLRLGSRPVLVVSSVSAAEECFTKNDINFANRPQLLYAKYLGYNYNSIVWGPYGDHWRNLRRISSIEILSTYRLQKLSQIRSDEVQTLIQRLVLSCGEDKYQTLHVKPVLSTLMFNVMTRMIAGKKFFGEDTLKSEEAKRFKEIIAESSVLVGASNVGEFMPIIRWLLFNKMEKKLKILHKKRDGLVQKWIEEFRDKISDGTGESEEKSMIEILLSLQHKEPEYYTDETIKSLMLALLQAGVSTSVDTMEWAMAFLLNSPNVLKKAQSEIDNCVPRHRLIDETDLAELPYLKCIIRETMRMSPVAPFLVPHESSMDSTVCGFFVPRKTMLLVNVKSIQNDPGYWEDPDIFMPERFEGLDVANVGCKWMPFGSGRRGCPGEGLAMRIVGLTLGALIQCFDWDRMGEEMVDMTTGSGLTAPMAQPLMAKYRPRPTMINLLSQI
ncbi:hypothetical protein DCAR_0309993 [Daucus carota subsp. sativus]|uniref:Cytochrome P450 n=1 Tax=Daucus carota subsp. sativus TaxID=79200 RepID=A0AAF1API8_DAUCS|nr:PREDICTED: cytochrome P450 81E8-like [Daucus carota subsp. sativus]WOG90749.1 hypothetical protein DCAR_0309993 [Daucus carota subsp. sativus]